MRKVIIALCGFCTLFVGVAFARTWIESKFASFSITLNRDTPGAALQLLVRAETQDAAGNTVRSLDNVSMSQTQIAPAERLACRSCYDAVLNAYSLSEVIPTPKVSATP